MRRQSTAARRKVSVHKDTQVLHPELARRLQAWLATKPKLGPEDLLFPVSARAGGIERTTHKMMQHDLESARMVWLKEAESPQDQEAREKSDFLAYANHAGAMPISIRVGICSSPAASAPASAPRWPRPWPGTAIFG